MEDQDQVVLSTLHASYMMQFPTVYLIDDAHRSNKLESLQQGGLRDVTLDGLTKLAQHVMKIKGLYKISASRVLDGSIRGLERRRQKSAERHAEATIRDAS